MSNSVCVKVALAPSLRVHVSLKRCPKPGGGGSTGGGTVGGGTVAVSGFSDNSGALLADASGAILQS